MKKLGNICRWTGGILLLMLGLLLCFSSVRAGILCLLSGALVLPVVWRKVRKAVRYPKWVAVAVPLIFFLSSMAAIPATEASDMNTGLAASAISEDSSGTENATSAAETAALSDSGAAVLTETPAPEPTQTPAGDMTVHFLDVGQGLSIFVQSEGQNLIYDGGDRDTSSFVVAYLKEHGVTTLDYLISSHYDSDHVYGLIGCLNAFEVKNVISSDYVHDSETYESFVDAVEQKGLTMQHPAVGTEFEFGAGSFTILAPAETDGDDSNNHSVVIRLVNGENSFLFTGDAESESESRMCSSGLDLSCDVLVPGHHGSATATSWEFLQAATPEYAVISCGEGNPYGHPDKDTMDKLEAMEVRVFRTDQQGTIVAASDGAAIRWDQEPCDDYTPGEPSDTGTQPAQQSVPQTGSAEASSGQDSQPSGQSTQAADPPSGQEQPAETQPAQQSVPQTPVVTETPAAAPSPAAETSVGTTPASEEQVWVSATGSKYHKIPDCGNMNPDKARQMTRSEAETLGLGPCKKCY